jgi:hypothetical protein
VWHVFSCTLRPVFLTTEGTFRLCSLLATRTPESPKLRDFFFAEHSLVKYIHCEMRNSVSWSVNRAAQVEEFSNVALKVCQF